MGRVDGRPDDLAGLGCPPSAGFVAYIRKRRLVRPREESSALSGAVLGLGNDVMGKYEELGCSPVTPRSTPWRRPSPNGGQLNYTEHPSADIPLPTTPVTTPIRARIHNDETSTTVRSDR